MSANNGRARPSWSVLWRAPIRALLLGGLGAVGAGMFAAFGGAVLCLIDGMPWSYAGAWGLRGAFAGLVAGAVLGAFSGLHHVEERRSARRTAAPDAAAPAALQSATRPVRIATKRPGPTPRA